MYVKDGPRSIRPLALRPSRPVGLPLPVQPCQSSLVTQFTTVLTGPSRVLLTASQLSRTRVADSSLLGEISQLGPPLSPTAKGCPESNPTILRRRSTFPSRRGTLFTTTCLYITRQINPLRTSTAVVQLLHLHGTRRISTVSTSPPVPMGYSWIQRAYSQSYSGRTIRDVSAAQH
jgi:hypothetical protein